MNMQDERTKRMGELLKAEIALTNLASVPDLKICNDVCVPESVLPAKEIVKIKELCDENSTASKNLILKILHANRMIIIKEIISLAAKMHSEKLQNELTETMKSYERLMGTVHVTNATVENDTLMSTLYSIT